MSKALEYPLPARAINNAAIDEIGLCRTVLSMTRSAILVADVREQDTPLIWVSEQFEQITGYGSDEAVGKNCRYLQGSDRLQPEIAEMQLAINRREQITLTLRNYRRDGKLFWNQISMAPLSTEAGKVTHFVGLMRDVTATKESFDKVQLSGRTDLPTGVLNRSAFLDDVDFIATISNYNVLISKIDIAGVHRINSSYGDEIGDFLIKRTAERLGNLDCFALGRMGSNEFAMAFQVCSEVEVISHIKAINEAMEPPFVVGDNHVHVGYALGYAVGKGSGENTKKLTQDAGYALYQSKADPLRRHRRFDDSTMRTSQIKRKLINEIREGLSNWDFLYYYQPKVNLKTGDIYGAEALLRWNHPIFGLQEPSFFMSTAEEFGMIVDIEKKGMEYILCFASSINSPQTATKTHISMNMSPISICRDGFVDHLTHCLDKSDIDPKLITLEITESILIEKSQDMKKLLDRVRETGVGLSIDDFGTGYSSLSSVTSFPVSEIKIDKSFTQGMVESGVMRIIAETVLSLGAELHADVVAEGIETEAQRKSLLDMGCTKGQGYLFSRPVSDREFVALLRGQNEGTDTLTRLGRQSPVPIGASGSNRGRRPCLVGLSPDQAQGGSRDQVGLRVEGVVDGGVGSEKSLS